MPRVPQHPPDEMPDEGATTGTSHHARLQARASASAANSYAPALDDVRARWAGRGLALRGARIGPRSGGRGDRPAGAWAALPRFGTAYPSRSWAVADVIGARLACTVAMIASVSMPWSRSRSCRGWRGRADAGSRSAGRSAAGAARTGAGRALGASGSRECSPSLDAEAPGRQRVILAVESHSATPRRGP
jgi:hypothetical protein